jgi:hypothetical protein
VRWYDRFTNLAAARDVEAEEKAAVEMRCGRHLASQRGKTRKN